MRGLGIVVFVIAMLSYTACTTTPNSTPTNSTPTDSTPTDSTPTDSTPSKPLSIILNGETYSETDTGKFISWRCYDYFEKYKTRKLFTLGFFSKSMFSGLGFILYDDSNSGELTLYKRKGLNHRWDWGSGGEFAFIIKPDGKGLFYDFSSVPSGERIKANDVYKCYS